MLQYDWLLAMYLTIRERGGVVYEQIVDDGEAQMISFLCALAAN
jgi:hypothetical protein